jgi:hypothetical protein
LEIFNMGLGHKQKFTGTVKRERVNVGSKSEHDAVVLDTGTGPHLKLRLAGGNPFHDPALDAFVGKRILVEGIPGSGLPFIMIEKVSDIAVLGPPGRPSKPMGPKP